MKSCKQSDLININNAFSVALTLLAGDKNAGGSCRSISRSSSKSILVQQWSLLNHFCTGQGHCKGPVERLGTLLCPCGETQMMSNIIESCPLTKLNGGLSQLHSADDAAMTNYGS